METVVGCGVRAAITMGNWKHGLCSCFGNCKVCCITYFLPRYTHGKVAESVTGDSCLLHGLMFYLPCPNFVVMNGCYIRPQIRKSKGIDGTLFGDFCATVCCTYCAICQQARETGALGSTDMAREVPVSQEMERA